MPHLLIAGQTGAGKSVMMNTIITSLLYRNSPADLKLILVDPKQVEMGLYNDLPHLLAPVINEPEKCISALKWAVAEMDRRLKTMAAVGKRNIEEYNSQNGSDGMPYIVIVIDEWIEVDRLRDLRDGLLYLYVYGRINYVDFSKETRTIQVCYRFAPDSTPDAGIEQVGLGGQWRLCIPPYAPAAYNRHT